MILCFSSCGFTIKCYSTINASVSSYKNWCNDKEEYLRILRQERMGFRGLLHTLLWQNRSYTVKIKEYTGLSLTVCAIMSSVNYLFECVNDHPEVTIVLISYCCEKLCPCFYFQYRIRVQECTHGREYNLITKSKKLTLGNCLFMITIAPDWLQHSSFLSVRIYGVNLSWYFVVSLIHNHFQKSVIWISHIQTAAMQNCVLKAQYAPKNFVLCHYSLG